MKAEIRLQKVIRDRMLETGYCFLTDEELADLTVIGRGTVQKVLAGLRKSGSILCVSKHPQGHGYWSRQILVVGDLDKF